MSSNAFGRQTRHLRVITTLAVDDVITLTPGVTLRRWTQSEAEELREEIRRRHMPSRLGPDSGYSTRARQLADHVVIEVSHAGMSLDEIRAFAAAVEHIIVAFAGLAGKRAALRRKAFGVDVGVRELTLVPNKYDVAPRSRWRSSRDPSGLLMTETDVRRLNRLGGAVLFKLLRSSTQMGARLQRAFAMLYESRAEPDSNMAAVKTSVALETMLTQNERSITEKLARRTALLLTDEPDERRAVAELVRRLYRLRSAVVHGETPKERDREGAIQVADRLLVLLSAVVAQEQWTDFSQLKEVCDRAAWGEDPGLQRTGVRSHLTRLVSVSQ